LDDKTPLYAGFANCIRGNVRRKLIQFGTTFILTLCIWGHVSEIFDHWDNTFQTGNDIEHSTVIVVLIAGAVIGFAHIAGIVLRTVLATSCLLPLFAAYRLAVPNPAAFLGQSPPRPLRPTAVP
jgi:hypothetical protein